MSIPAPPQGIMAWVSPTPLKDPLGVSTERWSRAACGGSPETPEEGGRLKHPGVGVFQG